MGTIGCRKEVEKGKEKEISSFATWLPELKRKGIHAKKCYAQSRLISLVKC